MRTYIIRRLLLIIPTLFLVTIVAFLTLRFIPGDVIDLMAKDMLMTGGDTTLEEAREIVKERLGMDVPIYVQYGRWLGAALQGDLGESLWTHRSITEDITNRLPISLELGTLALIIALLIAIPIGVYSGIRQDTWGDYGGRSLAILAISLPSFWVATMVIVYASVWWKWTPSIDYIPLTQDLAGNLVQFIVPATILGMLLSGTTMRMTRSMMLEVLRQDYIRTAWAKGLNERTIIIRHALKNALMPVVTIVGVMTPVLIGGEIVLEQIFALPGMGRFLIDALNQRDYPIIMGINVVVACFVLVINLLVDLTYSYLDPRIQYR